MILFLDFDGVLHPSNRRDGVLSCLPQFEAFMREHPTVDIVISSAWRTDHDLPRLQAYFSADIGARIIDVTPDFYVSGWANEAPGLREKEIRWWLKDRGHSVEDWVALDDVDVLFTRSCLQLVLVDCETGFDEAVARELRERFSY